MADTDDTKSRKTTKTAAAASTAEDDAASKIQQPEEPPPPAQEEEEGGFKKFVWNSEKKEFFGRGWKSWLLITIFYIIFFAMVGSYFALQWFIALLPLSPDSPYRRQGSSRALLLLNGPALTYRPVPDRTSGNAASSLLWIEPNSYTDYGFWTDQLEVWFSNMPIKSHLNVKECYKLDYLKGGTIPMLVKQKEAKKQPKESCYIDRDWYGPCGKGKFGYDLGEPCILFKLNRIYDWVPIPIPYKEWRDAVTSGEVSVQDPDDKEKKKKVEVPKALAQHIKNIEPNKDQDPVSDSAVVWCDGEFDHDKEMLGSWTFYPGPFIPKGFFPFKGQTNYQSPFVAMQLHRPIPGALISIVCRVFAKNIFPDRETGVGYARFQVMIG